MNNFLKKLEAGNPVTLVALGDSTTEETFYTLGHMNWVSLLREALAETYGSGTALLVNAGLAGDTYGGALARLDRDVLRFSPDLVVLALGLNDALGQEDHLADFEKEVRETVRRIREHGPSEILIRTPNPVVTERGMPLSFLSRPTARSCMEFTRSVGLYARSLAALGRELEIPVVDHHRLWTKAMKPDQDPPGLWLRMGDAVHPNHIGHRVFFREMAAFFGVPERFTWEESGMGRSG